MKLIVGQFTQGAIESLQQALENAMRYGQDIIFPYWGETPVQVIDLSRGKRRARWYPSLHAHKVHL